MLRAIVLSLLALATALPAASAVADVNTCERYYICPFVVVQPDPARVCAGLGLGLQGVGACAYERADGALCARVVFGFDDTDTCNTTDRLAFDLTLP